VLIITPLDQIQQNLLRKETCQTTAKPADIVLETSFEKYSTPPYPLHTIKFIPDSDMLSPYSKEFHSVNPLTVTFANLAEPGSLRKRWNFHLRMSAKRVLFYFQPNSDRFRTCSGAMRWPCTMNVWNEPIHEIFCV